jgi:hypothetical protein
MGLKPDNTKAGYKPEKIHFKNNPLRPSQNCFSEE